MVNILILFEESGLFLRYSESSYVYSLLRAFLNVRRIFSPRELVFSGVYNLPGKESGISNVASYPSEFF